MFKSNLRVLINFRYKFTATKFDLKSLKAFYTGWKEGKLIPFSHSEENLGGEMEKGVLVLDKSTFYKTIRQENTETMVFFYHDDCDICEMFLQIYEKVKL